MRVIYDGREVRDGSCIHPGDALPCVEFETRAGTYSSMVMFDPDAVGGNKIHWLVVNIGSSSGTTLLQYVPPNPPPGSGVHRYIFWILEHDHRIVRLPRLSDRFITMPMLLSLLGVVTTIADTFFFVARK